MTDPDQSAPKVFVSYSWDDDGHRDWVRGFASRLRSDGVDAELDRWKLSPGDQLPEFMERAVRENDAVLIVCTPRYKARADGRVGGVWNFLTRAEDGESRPISCLDYVPLQGRRVAICYDSDVAHNENVRLARERFAEELHRRGAIVYYITLLTGPNGEKIGLDDYLLTQEAWEVWSTPPCGLGHREAGPRARPGCELLAYRVC